MRGSWGPGKFSDLLKRHCWNDIMLKSQIALLFLEESFFIASHNTVRKLLWSKGPKLLWSRGPKSWLSSTSRQKGCLRLLYSSEEIYSCFLPRMLYPKASDMKNETNKINFRRGYPVEHNCSFFPTKSNNGIGFPYKSSPFVVALQHLFDKYLLEAYFVSSAMLGGGLNLLASVLWD